MRAEHMRELRGQSIPAVSDKDQYCKENMDKTERDLWGLASHIGLHGKNQMSVPLPSVCWCLEVESKKNRS